MATLPVEIKFAQNLAGNEKKIRYKAVKKLKKFLKAKSSSKKDGFTTEDFLKIWKGLHYCMWMQDKPLLQEELSTTLSQLVHDLATTEAKMLFIKVFFVTEAREWNSIDVWRLDKFMMLVRNVLNESLLVVKKMKWEPTVLGRLMQAFSEAVLNPDLDTIPDGLKIHFTDIYLEEAEKVGEGKLTGSQLLTLLVPFIKYIQKEKNTVLVRRVISRLFDPVLTRITDDKKASQQQHQSDADNENETDEKPYQSLKFDGKLIADYVFDISQQECVLSRNRPLLYGIVTKLRDIEKGVFPQKKEIVIDKGISHNEIQLAVNSLVSLELGKKHKKRKKKKKGKQEKDEVNENADPNNNNNGRTAHIAVMADNQPSTSAQIGGKRKHDNDANEALTKIKKKKLAQENSEDISEESSTLKKLKNKFAKLDLRKEKLKSQGIEDRSHVPLRKEEQRSLPAVNQGKQMEEAENTKCTVSPNASGNKANEYKDRLQTSRAFSKTVGVSSPKSHGKRTIQETENTGTSLRQVNDVSGHKGGAKNTKDVAPSVPNMSTMARGAKKIPKIVITEASPPKVKDIPDKATSSDLQDGEIEVFIPNKKFKGTPESSAAKTPNANFAAFDGTRPPVAFVKRSLSKLKKTPSSLKAPGSGRTASTGSAKRVSFNMKKNKAQGFKESLSSPITPFNPMKTPESGILKSPALRSSTVTSEQCTSSNAKNSNITPQTGRTTRSQDASNFLTVPQSTPHIIQATLQPKQSTPYPRLIVEPPKSAFTTPVITVGFERKKAMPARRMKARDFFL